MSSKTAAAELMRCDVRAGKAIVPVKLRDRIVDYLNRIEEPEPKKERRTTKRAQVPKTKTE